MFDRASRKLGLDRAVLGGMVDDDEDDAESKKLTASDVDTLLKQGAYAALNVDDGQWERFSEQNIEDILRERSQTIGAPLRTPTVLVCAPQRH